MQFCHPNPFVLTNKIMFEPNSTAHTMHKGTEIHVLVMYSLPTLQGGSHIADTVTVLL